MLQWLHNIKANCDKQCVHFTALCYKMIFNELHYAFTLWKSTTPCKAGSKNAQFSYKGWQGWECQDTHFGHIHQLVLATDRKQIKYVQDIILFSIKRNSTSSPIKVTEVSRQSLVSRPYFSVSWYCLGLAGTIFVLVLEVTVLVLIIALTVLVPSLKAGLKMHTMHPKN